MSIAALRWARKQTTGGIGPKAVLFALADMAGDDGCAWPAQETLATDCDCDIRTIRRALQALEDRGLIRREVRRRADGSRQTDRIRLVFDQPAKLSACDPEAPEPTGQSVRSNRPNCPVQPAKLSPLTSFEPSREPSEEPPPPRESAKSASAAPAMPVVVPLDPRERLIGDIVGTLMRVAGQDEATARRTLEGWLRIAAGDLVHVGSVVAESAILASRELVFTVEERLRRRRVRAHSPPRESTNGRLALIEERHQHHRYRRALP